MKIDLIREAYLDYFAHKRHAIIPSSSLIPSGDPTLLLTTAGMVQFKPYFQGLLNPPNPRLTSCQKCFRTTDLDSVGDYKHLTFFEMLGNFSIGDYFKKEAISWAWEFVTGVLKIKPDKLWVTVYLDDDEACAIWREVGIPEKRIVRLGEKYNFWGPAGDSGPCGPCSEIHYDYGNHVGCLKDHCGPDCDCGRFTEIWNLVFTQYNQASDGKRSKLPKPNIDTGMGLERTAAIMQGVSTVYDIDSFSQIRNKISCISNYQYGKDRKIDRAVRIISDHARGLTFLISDGVIPSNEGRGYVLRRVLRKASFFGRKLGLERPFLCDISGEVINIMGNTYPEIVTNRELIFDVIKAEEEKFFATIQAGMSILEKTVNAIISKGENIVSGEDLFRLYDTYGFPPELTGEIASERGLKVDIEKFEKAMFLQREKSRGSHKFITTSENKITSAENNKLPDIEHTVFTGYHEMAAESRVLRLFDSETMQMLTKGTLGQKVAIVLDRTPFYGERGGQVGDRGEIRNGFCKIVIEDTVWSPFGNLGEGYIIHKGIITLGEVNANINVRAEIDIMRRIDIARNHTATHLLHNALRKLVGIQVHQRGSLVSAEKLRFDFAYGKGIDKQTLDNVQYYVNEAIRKNIPVTCEENVPFERAATEGAIALFGEKYGNEVRVLKVPDPVGSAELCGGTHVAATGEIGFFQMLGESSVGTGIRRIEAITGRTVESFFYDRIKTLEEASAILKTSPIGITDKINNLLGELSVLRKRTDILERRLSKDMAEELIKSSITVNGISIIAAKMNDASVPALRELGDSLKLRLKSAVIVLGTIQGEKPFFLGMVTDDLVQKKLNADDIIKQVAIITGGSGGGKPDIAQAGGRDKDKIDFALSQVVEIVMRRIEK